MTFKEHVNMLIARMKIRVQILKKLSSLSWGSNINILAITYKSLIQNCIAHGIGAWGGNVPEEKIQRINIEVIHPALRVITGNKKWCRIENLYMSVGALNVQNLFTERSAMLLDRIKRIKNEDDPAVENMSGTLTAGAPVGFPTLEKILHQNVGIPRSLKELPTISTSIMISARGGGTAPPDASIYTPSLYDIKKRLQHLLGVPKLDRSCI